MQKVDWKHIRIGDQVFLKTQVLKRMSEEINLLSHQMVELYANDLSQNDIDRLEQMIHQRAEILLHLTKS